MKTLIWGYKGIGGAIARILAQQGHPVHLVGRTESELQSFCSSIAGVSFSVGDCTKKDDVIRVTEEAAGQDGLNGVAFCVGSIRLRRIGLLKDEEILSDFHLNALSAVHIAQASYPHLQKASSSTSPSLLLFSSIAVQRGFPLHTSVSLSKGAIEGLTRALAAEWAPSNVRVNCIAPSLCKTPMASGTFSGAVFDVSAKSHLLGRVGTPEDPAHMAALLLSPNASWITGQVIAIDGGKSVGQK